MMKTFKWSIALIGVSAGLMAILSFDTYFRPSYEPILMSREDMEAAVQLRESRDIEKPGKIWVYNQFIFVIEKYKGVHVLDNSNPSNPQNVGFIQIDGCTDVAVKNGLIYANNAVDLIGIKPSSDYQSIEVVSRNREVLPELASPESWGDSEFRKLRPDNTVIVRWEPYNR